MLKKLLLVALVFSATSVFGAASIFLKLGDIKGESTDKNHKGWIEVESYSMPAVRGTNKVTLKVRPGSWTSQAAGKSFSNVILDAGPVRYTFNSVQISSTTGGSNLTMPQVTMDFTYGTATLTTPPQLDISPDAPPTDAPPDPSVRSAPAQVFVNGVPADKFTLVSFERRSNGGVLQLRNAPATGFFATNRMKNGRVNVRAAGQPQFLEMQMTECIISSYSAHPDGTATATFTFSSYRGPVTVRP
jgi:type VI protein secretion system component Hcp